MPGPTPTVDHKPRWAQVPRDVVAPRHHIHSRVCSRSGNDVDVAPSLPGATFNIMIPTAMPTDLIQPPAMMLPHQCRSHSPYTLYHSEPICLAHNMNTLSAVRHPFVEVASSRLAAGSPGYVALKSQPSLASVSSVPSAFVSAMSRSTSHVLLPYKRAFIESVSIASPFLSPTFVTLATGSQWLEGKRGFLLGWEWHAIRRRSQLTEALSYTPMVTVSEIYFSSLVCHPDISFSRLEEKLQFEKQSMVTYLSIAAYLTQVFHI
jgi:hypothetical protein